MADPAEKAEKYACDGIEWMRFLVCAVSGSAMTESSERTSSAISQLHSTAMQGIELMTRIVDSYAHTVEMFRAWDDDIGGEVDIESALQSLQSSVDTLAARIGGIEDLRQMSLFEKDGARSLRKTALRSMLTEMVADECRDRRIKPAKRR